MSMSHRILRMLSKLILLISTAADLSQPPADAPLRSTHSHCSFRYSHSHDTDWLWPELRSRILIINRTVLSAQTQMTAWPNAHALHNRMRVVVAVHDLSLLRSKTVISFSSCSLESVLLVSPRVYSSHSDIHSNTPPRYDDPDHHGGQ